MTYLFKHIHEEDNVKSSTVLNSNYFNIDYTVLKNEMKSILVQDLKAMLQLACLPTKC